MPYDATFESQLKNWISGKQSELQKLIDNSHRQASIAQGQFNPGMVQHWSGTARQYEQQLGTLNEGSKTIFDKLKGADMGSESLKVAQDALIGDPLALERISEQQAGQQQLSAQNQKLEDFRNQLETQQFGGKGVSLTDALTSTGGDIGNLNKFLGGQEARTFNEQLKPLIQMALGAQGLTDSGANVELQSKALGQLQQTREQNMMQAALGARSQIQGLQRQDVLGDIGAQQTMMNNQFDLSRAGITMQFQRELEAQREQLARELSARRGGAGGAGLGSMIGAGVGALGFISGNPQIGLMGMGLGSTLGGSIGGIVSPGYGDAGSRDIGGSFFAASNMLGSRQGAQTRQNQPQTPQTASSPYGPYKNRFQSSNPYLM